MSRHDCSLLCSLRLQLIFPRAPIALAVDAGSPLGPRTVVWARSRATRGVPHTRRARVHARAERRVMTHDEQQHTDMAPVRARVHAARARATAAAAAAAAATGPAHAYHAGTSCCQNSGCAVGAAPVVAARAWAHACEARPADTNIRTQGMLPLYARICRPSSQSLTGDARVRATTTPTTVMRSRAGPFIHIMNRAHTRHLKTNAS